MDELFFNEIGVLQNDENQVLQEIIQEAKLNSVESASNGRQFSSSGMIANSIIENIIPIGDNDAHDSEEYLPLPPKFSGRRKTVPASRPSPSEKLEYPSKSVSELNDILSSTVEILQLPKRRRTNQKQSTQNQTLVYTCPVCQLDLYHSEEGANDIINKHLDRCLKRRNVGRNEEVLENHLEEVEESDFSFSSDDGEITSTKKRNFKKLKQSKSSVKPRSRKQVERSRSAPEDDYNPTPDKSDDDREIEEIELGQQNGVGDDWEEIDYQRRIQKIDNNNLELVETPYGTQMVAVTWNKLYEYQREGCRWLHSLYTDGVGGILADEMGLGKTAQMAAHLGSLGLMAGLEGQASQAIFLIVCPATVLQHWLKEMHQWAPIVRTGILHSISSTGKQLSSLSVKQLERVFKTLRSDENAKGIAVITTYEGLRRNKEALGLVEWSAVCLDEGQKIRNINAEITLACKRLPAYHRIILSGTPIQNSLRELWSLFDFIYPGRLGALQIFENDFANPIRIGGYVNASKIQYEVAIRCAATLQRIVRPYLLRRKKDDLTLIAKLPAKTEQVLFCTISPRQKEIYKEIISSSEVRAVIAKRTPAFRAITTLRKLCNHPLLVYQNGRIIWQDNDDDNILSRKNRKVNKKMLIDSVNIRDSEEEEEEEEDNNVDVLDLLHRTQSKSGISWSDSGKLLVLSKILPIWYKEGSKVLIFTQTVTMLYLIEDMMQEMNFSYLKLDGTTPISKRNDLIESFNSPKSKHFVMLLTTRTGGLGISLTSANRVILFDPDWNPMTDIQARERAWRLGQQREVIIYRLITKGTIEEKIYRRQIFKLLLSNRILENPKQKALFSKSQVEELFELNCDISPSSTGNNNIEAEIDCLPKEGQVFLSNQNHDIDSHIQAETAVEEKSGEEIKAPGEEENQDKLILKALFDGEAITSVYDHEYLEPGIKSKNRKDQNMVEKTADQIVNRAIQNLESSSTVYLGSSSAQAAQSSSSSASNQNEVANSRFGSQRSSSSSGLASSSLLSRMRANRDHQNNQNSSGQSSSAPSTSSSSQSTNGLSRISSVQDSQSQPSSLLVNSTSSSNAEVGGGIVGNIRSRLHQLFDRHPKGMKTESILEHFRDLGDQYAPLFKQTLRSIAQWNGTVWKRM